MIDYLSLSLPPLEKPLNDGMVLFVRADGSIDYGVERFLSWKGSYESSLQVRSTCTELKIRGNPAKFIQGHNLFGTLDLKVLLRRMLRELRLLLEYDDLWLQRVMNGAFSISRIDVTFNFRLPSSRDTTLWLDSLKQVASHKRQNVGLKGDTVYFGLGSQRSLIKFYDKEKELSRHPIEKDYDPYVCALLREYAKGLLRVEVQVRKKALEDEFNLLTGEDWLKLTESDLRNMWGKKMESVVIPDMRNVTDDLVQTMKPALRGPYMLWQNGISIKQTYSRMHAYRLRKQFLAEYQIDIFQPFPVDQFRKTARVVPLLRPLEAVPEKTPSWAYELGLIAA